MLKLISLCAFAFLTSSCAIKPQFEQTCGFPMVSLETDQPPDGASLTAADTTHPAEGPSLVSALDTSLKSPYKGSAEPVRMLFLSGGGQHGAFGAGFLAEWAAKSPGAQLPEFDVVTGISTGAILATWAFLQRGEDAAASYHIDNESRLLKPYVKMRDGKLTPLSYVNLLRRGAVADLGPLREYLLEVLTDKVIDEVGNADSRRRLLVGAVDVDSGHAVAFDLKAMAERFHHTNAQTQRGKAERKRFRHCYAEAILASASAPLAARPVFIDNRMYIDGGARFGVFDAALSKALALQGDHPQNKVPPKLYMIINGTQDVAPLCPQTAKTNTMQCNAIANPRRRQRTRHASWNFPDLALRSEDILTNQIYRFSVADVANRNAVAYPGANNLFFARIHGPDLQGFAYKPDDAPDTERRTCKQWHQLDADTLHPVQFYPHYMDCVSAYGRSRAHTLGWSGKAATSD